MLNNVKTTDIVNLLIACLKVNELGCMMIKKSIDSSAASGPDFFGFGFHRVFKFQQSSGSGLSGFTSKVQVLGFIGFVFRFYKKMLTLT